MNPKRFWMLGVMTCLIMRMDAAASGTPEVAEPARSLPAAFRQANERYRQGQFAQAAEGYHAMLKRGVESGALYYNLGNALLKNGQRGEALWAYLKARTLLPRDPDVHANLTYTQSLLGSGVKESIRPPRVVRWLTLHHRFTTAELAREWIVLWWCLVACRVGSAWVPGARRALGAARWLVGTVTAIFLMALVAQTGWVDSAPQAVVIRDQAEVKFAPQNAATTHFTLPEGAVVFVRGRELGWIQIRRADDRAGWVPEDVIRFL